MSLSTFGVDIEKDVVNKHYYVYYSHLKFVFVITYKTYNVHSLYSWQCSEFDTYSNRKLKKL